MRPRPILEMIFASDLRFTELAVSACSSILQTLGFSEEETSDICMALRESVNNAVVHGNRRSDGKHVMVRFYGILGSITMLVRDEGTGFDPASVPDPTAPENLLRPCGRGIFFMRHFMDDVAFRFLRTQGTEVKLMKRARMVAHQS